MFTALAVLLVTWLARDLGRADRLDSWWLWARFSLREAFRGPQPPDPGIVLVTLDDRSIDAWPEPLIAWGPHLAAAIDRLEASGAKVIALDWIQPTAAEKWFPGHDQRLGRSLHAAGNVVMAKMLREGSGGRGAAWILPTPGLLYALPHLEEDLGYVEVTAGGGGEGVVAALSPAVGEAGAVQKSFALRAVERALGTNAELRSGRLEIPGRRSVPLRSDGSLLVNYAGGPDGFERYSLYDVARLPKRPDPRFRDKIVIVGATYTGCNDFHYIPVLKGLSKNRMVPGLELHANLARTLLDARPIQEPGPVVLWALAVGLSLVGLAAFGFLDWARATGACLAAAAVWLAASFVSFIGADSALPIGLPLLGLALSSGMMGGYRALGEERERRQVLGLWGRYQDPRLVEYLLRHPEARGGDGREVTVTVLFADLKNFTKTVEALAPGEALEMLNRYLGLMSAVILQHGGVVDKYLGDGLMAQWGVPEPRADHAEAAVRACREIELRVRGLSDNLLEGRDATFGLRLTLHSGPVVLGWVGSSRLEFTIIGDTVNVTSRLQETAKELDCEFLISESTYAEVRSWVRTGKEAEVAIRGRQQPLRVYEVVGEQAGGEVSDHAARALDTAALPGGGADRRR